MKRVVLTIIILINFLNILQCRDDSVVYLIRHGEKPDPDVTGLNQAGKQRAQCLVNIFGSKGPLKVGKIIAQRYDSDGSHDRPFLTALPTSIDLDIIIDLDNSLGEEDKVANAIQKSDEDFILVVWEHKALSDILKELGVKNAPKMSDEYDDIWVYQNKKVDISQKQHCSYTKNLSLY